MDLQNSKIASNIIELKKIMKNTVSLQGILDRKNREKYSQIYTPEEIANYMASMFEEPKKEIIRILDPGSGFGILTIKFLINILKTENNCIKKIIIDLYEIDKIVIKQLNTNMNKMKKIFLQIGIEIKYNIYNENFIASYYNNYKNNTQQLYDYAILNPPYKKLKSNSNDKLMLRDLNINVTNYYSAFVCLVKRLLVSNGELVAITPRSFCNGDYFLWFREDITKDMIFKKIHLFESRYDVFKSDQVLQESIIYHCIKKVPQNNYKIKVCYSKNYTLDEIVENEQTYNQLIFPDDNKKVIRILKHNIESNVSDKIKSLTCSLDNLDISVSCGPIVEFREKDILRKRKVKNGVPLFYSEHISSSGMEWPKKKVKKYNYIIWNKENNNKLRKNGNYVLVKRMTSKEEKKRINATLCIGEKYHFRYFGFDNKVNYYHSNNQGLPLDIAKGLTLYLNSSFIDIYFRTFSGSTQVNVSDLKSLQYPNKQQLKLLAREYDELEMKECLGRQEYIDQIVYCILFNEE